MTHLQIIQVNKLLHDRLAYVRNTVSRPDCQQARQAADIKEQVYRAIVQSNGITLDELLPKFDLERRSLGRHVTNLLKDKLILKFRDGYSTYYTGRLA